MCRYNFNVKFDYRKILEQGGSVVDSAIASLLCNGILNAQSMGLGGGFFMLHYNK
jgi:gamma-glutamyltranspeptidase/glutathione hydrolase/leukotriene-C4 hydrolase